jgi:hypothetical protein
MTFGLAFIYCFPCFHSPAVPPHTLLVRYPVTLGAHLPSTTDGFRLQNSKRHVYAHLNTFQRGEAGVL